MIKVPLPLLLSRIALAFCFLAFGLWEIFAPSLWTTYVPEFLKETQPIMLIVVHGALLSIAGVGVLSGYLPRFFTGLSAFMLLEICVEIFLQEGFTETFIRDAALLLFACALFADAVRKKRT